METNGPLGARALIVDQADDELFPGAALAVDQHRRVERRHACRELEHILHRGAARDEVLRGRVARDALAQQVQLALAFGDVPLAALEFLQTPVHGVPNALDLPSQIRDSESRSEAPPARHPSSLHPFRRPSTSDAPCARHSVSRK